MSSFRNRFEVHISSAVAEQFRRVHRRAALAGFDDRVLAAYNTIVVRLETDPPNFGEPLYHLPNMRLEIRCAAVAPLVVHFGVADDRRVVYVKGIDLIGQ